MIIEINTELSYENAELENPSYGSETVTNHLLDLTSHYDVSADKNGERPFFNDEIGSEEAIDDYLEWITCEEYVYVHTQSDIYSDLKGLAYKIINSED